MRIFIDTWGFITLFNKKEFLHKEVKNLYNKKLIGKYSFFTTDYIIDESITLIYNRVPRNLAESYVDIILKSIEGNDLNLIRVNKRYFDEAISLRKKYKDKPDISFTDLTSIAVIKDLQINEILTADKHFLQVGLDIMLLP